MTPDACTLFAAHIPVGDPSGAPAGVAPCTLAMRIGAEAIGRAGVSSEGTDRTVLATILPGEPRDMNFARAAPRVRAFKAFRHGVGPQVSRSLPDPDDDDYGPEVRLPGACSVLYRRDSSNGETAQGSNREHW